MSLWSKMMQRGKTTPAPCPPAETVPPPAAHPAAASLSPEELQAAQHAQRLVADHAMQGRLMQDGLTAFWKAMAEKYSLPAEFVCDMQSGELKCEEKECPPKS